VTRVLILFASVDGQAERIARRIGAVLDGEGHRVTIKRDVEPGVVPALREHQAVIVGAGIRFGHHSRHLEALVRELRGALGAMPNAFFSVSLSAGGPGARPANARTYVEDFVRATGWEPQATARFAGALRYSRYNPFIRFMMKLIVGAAGGDTDASRDYEYTDWAAVERFAREFARQLQAVTTA
jgi:menaquinone-dependent protoporphyrinogen oxidase